jgi:hypothetical protein
LFAIKDQNVNSVESCLANGAKPLGSRSNQERVT